MRPIKSVRVFSPNPHNRKKFAAAFSEKLGIDVRAVDTPEEAVRGKEVILIGTNSTVPVYKGAWFEPGQTVVSIVGATIEIDGERIIRRELHDDVFERSDVVVVNSKDQAVYDYEGDIYEPCTGGSSSRGTR